MSGRDGSRRRVLTRDERVLWNTVTKAIEPLRERPAEIPATESPKTAPPPARKSAKKAADPVAPKQAPVAPPPSLAPLGRRMKQRVARGKDAIGARLDLHGLTQSEAHAALLRFLRAASAREKKLVLVITGKGSRDGEIGVLRRQVPQWLALPEFRAFVIGYETAHVSHGGEGALYVRVRRAR